MRQRRDEAAAHFSCDADAIFASMSPASWRTHIRIIDDVMQQDEESSATNARPRDQR
jgi:hypothetical protein